MAERDLGFVGDEEAAGARVLAVAEGQVVDARADEVRLVVGRCAVAHAVEAVAVEFVWVRVHGWVPHAVAGDADDAAFGQVHVVG